MFKYAVIASKSFKEGSLNELQYQSISKFPSHELKSRVLESATNIKKID